MKNKIKPNLKISLNFLYLLFILGFAIPAHSAEGGVESLRRTSKAFASVAKEVSPSVVFIKVESTF